MDPRKIDAVVEFLEMPDFESKLHQLAFIVLSDEHTYENEKEALGHFLNSLLFHRRHIVLKMYNWDPNSKIKGGDL